MLTRSPVVFAAPRREPALGTGISNYSTVTNVDDSAGGVGPSRKGGISR